MKLESNRMETGGLGAYPRKFLGQHPLEYQETPLLQHRI